MGLQCFSLEGDEKQAVPRKLSKLSDDPEEEGVQKDMVSLFPSQDQGNDQNHDDAAVSTEKPDPRCLIHQDVSISILVRLSRSDYGSIAALNRSFRSLIRTGELYQLRRKMGIAEFWVYFSCNVLEWEAFDPNRGRWMHLPRMPSSDCFMCSDKESLAVGTELLVFGKEIAAPVVYGYNLLTNTWSYGKQMSVPRCLFASASFGEKAMVAGGCNPRGKILSVAELYNSDTKTWETLPNMNKARKMCSGVFMDGKFYALGGISEDGRKQLTCGEEYDFETKEWRVIPGMFPPRSVEVGVTEIPATTEAPPLVAAVNNELYAADYAKQELRRYVKERNKWVTIGSLPEGSSSMNGWGLAFRACGDRLVVIGGPSGLGGRVVEINSWIPDEGAPQWNLLARREIGGSFVYNCTVMGC